MNASCGLCDRWSWELPESGEQKLWGETRREATANVTPADGYRGRQL